MQNVTADIRTYGEYITHLNVKIQQAPADKAQAYLGTIEKIILEYDELLHHSEVQKKQLVLVFEEVIVEFEEWVGEIVKRLESGEIVTTDIEAFQLELTVSISVLFDISMNFLSRDVLRQFHFFWGGEGKGALRQTYRLLCF